mgnify:CR=1 FL=1
MWEKKEDPLFKNVEAVVWALTIITVLSGMFMMGWENYVAAWFIAVAVTGPILFKIYGFIVVLIILFYQWISNKVK